MCWVFFFVLLELNLVFRAKQVPSFLMCLRDITKQLSAMPFSKTMIFDLKFF